MDNKSEFTDSWLYFFTLKVAGTIPISSDNQGIFDDRTFSDEFLMSLIHCIEQEKMEIYGFVILPYQIHLILHPGNGELEKMVNSLKNATAHRILHLAGKRMASAEGVNAKEQLWLKRLFSQYINTGVISFWQTDGISNAIKIKVHPNQLKPITRDMLREYLQGSEKNYMQLGAEAFTRLMLESMTS